MHDILAVRGGAGVDHIHAALGPVEADIRPGKRRILVSAAPVEGRAVITFLAVGRRPPAEISGGVEIPVRHASEIKHHAARFHPFHEHRRICAPFPYETVLAEVSVGPHGDERQPVGLGIRPRLFKIGVPLTGLYGGGARRALLEQLVRDRSRRGRCGKHGGKRHFNDSACHFCFSPFASTATLSNRFVPFGYSITARSDNIVPSVRWASSRFQRSNCRFICSRS